jgi:hypothetical protein
MGKMKFKSLLAGASLVAAFAFSAGAATAATCAPAVSTDVAGSTTAVTITKIGNQGSLSIEATACAKTVDNPGAGGGDDLLDDLNAGLFDSFFTPAPFWELVGKVDADDGQEGDVDVTVSDYIDSGTWTANFMPEAVTELVVALKGGKQGAAAFLFKDLSSFTGPLGASLFEGTFDMALAGLVNDQDDGQAISNLTVAGVYVNRGGGAEVVIPLPAGLPLILTGLGALAAFRLRKRKAA